MFGTAITAKAITKIIAISATGPVQLNTIYSEGSSEGTQLCVGGDGVVCVCGSCAPEAI